jgi:putative flippase GtrA
MRLQNYGALGTAGRFMLVGVLNTLLDVGVFMLLRVWLGMAVLPTNVSAYGVGILNSFVWHRHWTYAHRPHKAVVAQFVQFALVSVSALLVNTMLVVLLAPGFSETLSSASLGDLAAKVCATCIGLGWNFTLNNLWTFGTSRCAVQRKDYSL